MSTTAINDTEGREMVPCLVCNDGKTAFHQLAHHLKSAHNLTTQQYRDQHPGAKILSPHAQAQFDKARAKLPNAPKTATLKGAAMADVVEMKKPEPKFLHFGVAKIPMREDSEASARKHFIPAHDEAFELDDAKLEILALGIQQKDNVMMVGPTGCGKTSLLLELAAIVNQPVRRINLHGDVRAADFVGEKVVEVDPKTNQAVVAWKDGILPDALANGDWLLLDEIDACPPQIGFVLQSVLEGGDLTLTADNGRVVKRHPNFRIIATANTIGKGDESGLYTGTNIMNEAMLDRFGTVMQFDYLAESQEVQVLVTKAHIDEPTARKMRECAKLVRQGVEKEEAYCTFSTRRLLRWAEKTVALRGGAKVGKHWMAAEIAIFNKLTKDDRKYVEGIVQRIMGKA